MLLPAMTHTVTSNYYYRANPLLLDANPNGGTSNKTVTEELEFKTIYLPTSKLP